MASIQLENLRKVFGSKNDEIVAVNDVDLEVEDGEFLVLVGPSGSGKSTILRSIAGLEELTSGKIFLGETEISGTKPRNRDIAMVFQSYALYPHLTARGNMSFSLRMQGVSEGEIDQRVETAAEMMEIGHLLDNMPDELSGGQKQRVSLGRAIVRDPEVFLMDEPLSNLDAKLRTLMRTEIQRLQQELGVTTIYVTHDQTEAMTMGDRIAIMHEGELQQVGTPLETYQQPENQFVAGFIGNPSMNFFDCEMVQTDSGVQCVNEDFTYTATDALPSKLPETDQQVVLGIRPEDVIFEPQQPDNRFTVDINVVEPLGKEQLLYFDIAGNEYIASTAKGAVFPTNSTVEIHFPEKQIHLFDAETGEAIVNCEYPEMEDRQQFADQMGEA